MKTEQEEIHFDLVCNLQIIPGMEPEDRRELARAACQQSLEDMYDGQLDVGDILASGDRTTAPFLEMPKLQEPERKHVCMLPPDSAELAAWLAGRLTEEGRRFVSEPWPDNVWRIEVREDCAHVLDRLQVEFFPELFRNAPKNACWEMPCMTYVLPQTLVTMLMPGRRLLTLWLLAGETVCAHYCFMSPLTRTFHSASRLRDIPDSQRHWFEDQLHAAGWSVAQSGRPLLSAVGPQEVDYLVRLPAS